MLFTSLEVRTRKIFSRGLQKGRDVFETEGKYFSVRIDKYGRKRINIFIKGELNSKIKFVLFERTLGITE